MKKNKIKQLLPHFPEEIIQKILSRLPVKTLMDFKRVCKSWNSLISNPHFINLHLNRSIDENRMVFLFLHDSDCSLIYAVPDNTSTIGKKIQYNESKSRIDFLASCNGLFCISTSEDDLYLWNPSTRESKKLPSSPIESPEDSCSLVSVFYGLGYDLSSDDYKLIRVCMFDSVDFRTEVRIYSRNSDSWKRISDFPYDFPRRDSGVFVRGGIHWIVSLWDRSVRCYMVAVVDLANESYGLIQLPKFSHENSYFGIGALEENLVLFHCTIHLTTDIWILKEYGKIESWMKINIVVPCTTRIEMFVYFKPLCVWKPDKLVLRIGAKRIVVYDFKQKMCRDILIPDMFNESTRIVSFVESLVSPYPQIQFLM